MDPITIATSLLGAGAEVAKLAAAAIEAARAGDDSKALELLDQAIAKQQAAGTAGLAALEQVKARVQAAIDEKFPPPAAG